jgi:adenosylhomocysteine nucleosidase
VKKVVFIAALESEFFTIHSPIRKIHYTGVGKINASRVTTQIILEEKPDLILNIGTAGCLRKELLGKAFGVNRVIERDMNAEPLAPRGVVPLDTQSSFYESTFGSTCCATGDSFVTSKDPWLNEKHVDLVDMELFAIAKIATHFGVEWKSIKFASDFADENAANDWKDSLEISNNKIRELLEQALSERR